MVSPRAIVSGYFVVSAFRKVTDIIYVIAIQQVGSIFNDYSSVILTPVGNSTYLVDTSLTRRQNGCVDVEGLNGCSIHH
jgi:hypothetical protein